MQEKILNSKKNGMPMLLLSIALYAAAILCIVFGGVLMDDGKLLGLALLIPGIVWVLLGWVLFCCCSCCGPWWGLRRCSSAPSRPGRASCCCRIWPGSPLRPTSIWGSGCSTAEHSRRCSVFWKSAGSFFDFFSPNVKTFSGALHNELPKNFQFRSF